VSGVSSVSITVGGYKREIKSTILSVTALESGKAVIQASGNSVKTIIVLSASEYVYNEAR
jgi:hypothetical protein